MLVNSNALLQNALKDGFAIPAYNINNLEWTRFILETCNDDKSPVILAVTPKSIEYFGGYKVVVNTVKSLIDELNIKVPVVLHLDHGKTIEQCKLAIDAGFTSVMLDASDKSLQDNINDTNEVVLYAEEKGVSVEAEIGSMNDINNENLANAEDAKRFVLETGVNSLAPAIGNLHGVYEKEPFLNFDLLGVICKACNIPLVLHGASGLDENKIKTAIFCGVSKININTDLMLAWSASVKNYLNYDKSVYDPRKIIKSGENSVKKVIHQKNNLFGSKNRAF